MEPSTTCRIVVADHPTLERLITQFLDALGAEPRYFGPSASSNPKPFPSLLRTLAAVDGFRLAAVHDDHIVGLARISPDGELHIAVAKAHRGRGVGTLLGRAALERAIDLDFSRIVMRSSKRSRAARRVGTSMGCVVVERERGRTDLIAHLPSGRRSA